MAIPEGYKALAKIGISYKGDYVSGTTYKQLDAVAYNGSTYLALIDNPVGYPSNDRVNWRYLARGLSEEIIESYSDLMANSVSGYLPDALAVKEGFNTVKSNLNSHLFGTGKEKTSNYFTLSSCDYVTKCGWCKVRGIFTCEKNASAFVAFCQNIPSNIWGNDYYNTAISSSGMDSVRIKIETDGTIMALGGTAGETYRFSISYPVE